MGSSGIERFSRDPMPNNAMNTLQTVLSINCKIKLLHSFGPLRMVVAIVGDIKLNRKCVLIFLEHDTE